MARAELNYGNTCPLKCEYYNNEGNGCFIEWCEHPDIESELYSKYGYVLICPKTGECPDPPRWREKEKQLPKLIEEVI